MRIIDWSSDVCSSDLVWQALNDPDVLRRCIPGCQSLTKESDTRMVATVEIKIGPIGARFNGAVELADINAPDSYTLIMEGQAGTVGFVKSIVKVQLKDDPAGTLLSWDADAQVGGRLAQLGGPIMDTTRSEEHTSELQSLMRISYAVFCLNKKTQHENYMSTLS